MAHMRPNTVAGAFFVSAMLCYGGRARETFGSAGIHSGRFANLRTAATLTLFGDDSWQLRSTEWSDTE